MKNPESLDQISIDVYKYEWLDNENKFCLENKGEIFDLYAADAIDTVMEEIEEESGIKKRSWLLTSTIIVILSLIGFLTGYFLILNSMKVAGGSVIMATPIIVFFLVVGYEMLQGSQVSRFNKWMKKNENRIGNHLRMYGTSMSYSINKAEYYVHKDKKKTLKDKIRLFCCKYSVEGSVSFNSKNEATAEAISTNKVSTHQSNFPISKFESNSEMREFNLNSGIERYKVYSSKGQHHFDQMYYPE